MDILSNQTMDVLAKALDGHAMRHKAIASNIANAETPGFKRMDVAFEDALKQVIDQKNRQQWAGDNSPPEFLPPGSLKTTHPGHYNPKPFPSSINDVRSDVNRAEFFFRQDGNGVDIDTEMAQLAKNSGKYNAIARMESQQFRSMRDVIKGGGM